MLSQKWLMGFKVLLCSIIRDLRNIHYATIAAYYHILGIIARLYAISYDDGQ